MENLHIFGKLMTNFYINHSSKKKKSRCHLKLSDNENTIYLHSWVMAKAKFWGVKMPMLGKNIFKSMTPTSTLETGKKLNTNWSEKKETTKVKIESMKSKQNKKRKSMKPKTLLFENINKISKSLAKLIRKKKLLISRVRERILL